MRPLLLLCIATTTLSAQVPRKRPVPNPATLLAAGDSSGALAMMALGGSAFSPVWPIDLAEMELIVKAANYQVSAPAWNSPIPGRSGMGGAPAPTQSDGVFRAVSNHLVYRIPALTSDSSQWGCVPNACRWLANQYGLTANPRLKDLALMAHLMLDPKHWRDSVLPYQPTEASFDRAMFLAKGVGNWGSVVASRAPMPAVGATPADWLEWINGVNAGTLRFNRPGEDSSSLLKAIILPSHVDAIHFLQAATGRDFVAEFKQRLAGSSSDTGRFIFRTLLVGLGAYASDPIEIASRLSSTSKLDRTSAVNEMRAAFRDNTQLADSTTAALLQGHLLASVFSGATPWPTLPGGTLTTKFPVSTTADSTQVLVTSTIQPSVVRAWASRFVMVDSTWRRPTDKASRYSKVSVVQRAGPFATVTFEGGGWSPGGPPFVGIFQMYLVEMPTGWHLVAIDWSGT